MKQQNTNNLTNILPDHIINKIKVTPIPITDVDDKLTHDYYAVKTAVWTNNTKIHPHPNAKFLKAFEN